MPGAIITANQPDGAGAGSPGVARRDLWLSQQIELVVGTSGNSSVEWALLSLPPGSSSSLTNPTSTTATFTPDTIGTYRVQLVTNGGGPGNVSIKVLRVRFDNAGTLSGFGWALPGIGEIDGESNYPVDAGTNLRAWAEVLEGIFADIETALGGAGGFTAGGDLSGTSTFQVVHGISAAITTPDIAFANELGSANIFGPGSATAQTSGGFFLIQGGKAGPADASGAGGAGGVTDVNGAPGGDGSSTHAAGPGGVLQLNGGNGGNPFLGTISPSTGGIGGDVQINGGETSTASTFTSIDHGIIRIGNFFKNGVIFGTQRVDDPVVVGFQSTIIFDLNSGSFQHVILTNSATFGLIRGKEGGDIELAIEQDGTGSRLGTFNSSFNFGTLGTPTLSTAAGKIDLIKGRFLNGKLCVTSVQKGY